MEPIAKVAIKSGNPIYATKVPFIKPTTTPIPRETKSAIKKSC